MKADPTERRSSLTVSAVLVTAALATMATRHPDGPGFMSASIEGEHSGANQRLGVRVDSPVERVRALIGDADILVDLEPFHVAEADVSDVRWL